MTVFGFVTTLGLAGLQVGPAADTGAPFGPVPEQNPDSAAVVAAVDAFHTALEHADTAAVRRLLSEDAIVQEGGGVEDRAEYLSHHLSADMAFAGAVQAERWLVSVEVLGDAAWVASTSRRTGTFRDREIDLQAAELMVLTRGPDGWRISAIHWSSRSRS
ncbi:MAG: nuclear transport factor 2 family protein [Candidatus Longimicrobiales bacterium M2_2A_002]